MVLDGIILSVSMLAAMVFQSQLVRMFVQLFGVQPDPLINQIQPLIYFEGILVVVGIAMVIIGLRSARR